MVLGAALGRARAVSMAALLVLWGAPRPADAQAPSGDVQGPEARRTALYRSGVEEATAGHWAEAKSRFAEALAIRASAKVFFSLAQAEEHLGQVATAEGHYARALEASRVAGENDVALASEQARATIAPSVPHVQVVVIVSGDDPRQVRRDLRATATIDGHPVAVGAPVAVDPGAHSLAVSAPGMRDATANLAIGEGQQLDVPVRMDPSTAPGPSAPEWRQPPGVPQGPAAVSEAPARTSGPWRTIGLVTLGAGVVTMAVGGAVALDAKSKDNRAEGEPGTARQTDSAGAVREGNAASVVLGAGAAVAAVGIVLWLAAPRTSAPGTSSAPPERRPSLAVKTTGRDLVLLGTF